MLRRSLVTALVLVCSAHAHAQGRAELLGLGTNGGTESFAAAINDSGQVAGTYAPPSGSGSFARAFLYTNGTMIDIGTLGGSYSQGSGINARGDVTGDAAPPGDPSNYAILYSNGVMQNLGTFGGQSVGLGINANGQVVGFSDFLNGGEHAFLYSGGVLQDIGTLGGSFSAAYAINASGQITGSASLTGDQSSTAFIYSGGSMQSLGSLGGNFSEGRAINASGQVAGYTGLASSSGIHAALFSGGTVRDLGSFGGDSMAMGMSDGGAIVGMSATTAPGSFDFSNARAFLWNGGTLFDLNTRAPAGWTLVQAHGINNRAQIVGYGLHNGVNEAYVLTLHPDWQGGNGYWGDASRWSFGGYGAMGITPSAPHQVVINPTGSATVYGADAAVTSLFVGGNAGEIVTLNLGGAAITTSNGTTIGANAALAGSGRLGGLLVVNVGGHVEVAEGERMQLTGGPLLNDGTINVLGTAVSPARLSIGGATSSDGQINLQSAAVSFLGGLTNLGRVNSTFGISTVAGTINNQGSGTIVVSNGAQVSFFDRVVNNGELRVSAGGAANFFGLVSGAGSFTGTGQSRFEGGFSPGNSPALVTVNMGATFSSTSPIIMELGGTTPGSGHDKIIFNGPVTLEGGDLDVVWYGGWSGAAGDAYDLFDWNDTLTGTFGHVLLPTLASGLTWDIASLYTTGEIGILAAVPEAETYAMLLAGLALLGFSARRRKAFVLG